jgi:membrane-bound lytic murein transglycosylase C
MVAPDWKSSVVLPLECQNGRTHGLVSSAPAYGLMQLVPTSGGRAALKRVQGIDQTPTPEYLLDPDHNIELGAAYLGVLSDNEFHAIDKQDSRDYCVIAAYNTGARNVTRPFGNDRGQALSSINALEPAALYEQLRTKLPFEETRRYVVRVTGYRRQFAEPAIPTTAMK